MTAMIRALLKVVPAVNTKAFYVARVKATWGSMLNVTSIVNWGVHVLTQDKDLIFVGTNFWFREYRLSFYDLAPVTKGPDYRNLHVGKSYRVGRIKRRLHAVSYDTHVQYDKGRAQSEAGKRVCGVGKAI